MKILVCIKQVPDTADIKWTENNTIQRDGVESIINPYDLYAIEHALEIKKLLKDVEITVLTMGPLQAETILRKAISVGCDRGVLLSDKKFAGSDTYATGKTLAASIKTHFNDFDLILCGQYAIDGDTAQTGPSVASQLLIPQVTYVKSISKCDGKSLYATREIEEGNETVKVQLPALICVLNDFKETARATINGIKKAQNAEIMVLNHEEIGLSPDDAGIKGSPTYVGKAFRPEHRKAQCSYCTDYKELAQKIKEFGGLNE